VGFGRPMEPLALRKDEFQQTLSVAESRLPPHLIVQSTQSLLACSADQKTRSIIKWVGLSAWA